MWKVILAGPHLAAIASRAALHRIRSFTILASTALVTALTIREMAERIVSMNL